MSATLFWTGFFVIGSFALYISIAIASRVSSTGEFYVAGHHIHPVFNGMATAADWMSAASFLSMAGLIAFSGYDGSVFLMGWTGGYVLLALLLAPYLRRFGKFTVPDFIGDRYYSDTARVVAVICAIFISFTYIAGQMQGVGIAFARFLDVPVETGVVVGGLVVLLYAGMGGMKGITYTQVAQYCVMIFAFMTPAIFISLQLTGSPIPQFGLIGNAVDGTPLLLKLDQTLVDLGFQAYTEGSKSLFDVCAITLALMAGTAGLPHVIIRFFTVPRASDARKSAGWALLFIAILYTTAPAVAVFARMNFIETVNESVYQPETAMAAGESATPTWFHRWENTGLLGFEDRNGDGRIQYRADPDTNEVTTLNRDIFVLANPEIANLPAWVIGLVVAGGIAAALSTAAGLLLVISSSISHDLCKKVLLRNITDKQELLIARLAALGAVLVAILAGIYPPGFVASVVALAFGLAAATFFPAILLGIFWQRATREGAIAGMLTGLIVTGAYILTYKIFGWIPNDADHWLFGVSPEGFGTIGMLVSFAVSIGVTLATPPPPEDVRLMVERIRAP
jgi:cation/acetate symporter